MTTRSSLTIPLLSSLDDNEQPYNGIEQEKNLLDTVVQLRDREEIEQLKNQIQVK